MGFFLFCVIAERSTHHIHIMDKSKGKNKDLIEKKQKKRLEEYNKDAKKFAEKYHAWKDKNSNSRKKVKVSELMLGMQIIFYIYIVQKTLVEMLRRAGTNNLVK